MRDFPVVDPYSGGSGWGKARHLDGQKNTIGDQCLCSLAHNCPYIELRRSVGWDQENSCKAYFESLGAEVPGQAGGLQS